MRTVCLPLLFLLALACAHAPAERTDALAEAALGRIDPDGSARLVFSQDVALDVRELMLRHRQPARLATEDELTYLPRNVVRIDGVSISGDEAVVRAWRGPVPRNAQLDCGTGYVLEYRWTGETWELGNLTVSVC